MVNFLDAIIFILPAFFANAAPVVLGGGGKLDLGKKFLDGRRIFGDGKTIRGFVGGVAAGIIVAAIVTKVYPLEIFDNEKLQFFSGCVLAFGTLVGDFSGSFIKRRMNVYPGKPFLLDQLSFLIVALFLGYFVSPKEFFTIEILVFLFGFTYIMHVGTNYIANKLGLKKVPW